MTKKDVIQLLEKIAIYMELKGENTFKVSAYRKAAQSLEVDERTLEEIDDVKELKGIGKGVGEVINEFKTKGQSSTLQALQDEVPEGLVPLLKIQGLGSKKIAKLYQELQITDKETLQKVARSIEAGRIQINESPNEPYLPFGGYKQSGIGREWGDYGIEEFLEVKSIAGYFK